LKNFTHPKPEISSNQTSLIRLRYFFFFASKTIKLEYMRVQKSWLRTVGSAVGGCFVVEDSLDELSVGDI